MLRSFLQLTALLLFALVALASLLVIMAYTGSLGQEARTWTEWGWQQAIDNSDAIQKAFALVGAISTLVISALGVYKTWHFAELNLPTRLEELAERWRRTTVHARPSVVPELRLTNSVTDLPSERTGLLAGLVSLVYASEQVALLRCSRRVDRFEKELRALNRSQSRCQAAILTGYLELGSRMRRCDPSSGHGILNLFKKPLEREPDDWDALELSGRQALAIGKREEACDFLSRLVNATANKDAPRHARALRFYSEILYLGTGSERGRARTQLERAITVLQNSDAKAPDAHRQELGLAHKTLAKVHLAAKRFRMAEGAVKQARKYLGDTECLRELEDRAKRR